MFTRHSRHDYIHFGILYLLAGLLVISSAILSVKEHTNLLKKTAQTLHLTKEEPKSIPLFNSSNFTDVSTRAKAFVIYDAKTGSVIAEKNKDAVLPLASLTKVMTAVTARSMASGNKQIKITPLSLDGGYDIGLQDNQVWKLNELLKYTLLFSSNDGAQAIADGLGGKSFFIEKMNEEAQVLGFATLHFTNPAGLDNDTILGGQGTALDVARLFSYATKKYPEIFDITTKERGTVTSNDKTLYGVPNTNQSISTITEAQASKTGFTDNAGGNLAVAVDITLGHPVIIVVLGSTKEERFSDVGTLYATLKRSIVK